MASLNAELGIRYNMYLMYLLYRNIDINAFKSINNKMMYNDIFYIIFIAYNNTAK